MTSPPPLLFDTYYHIYNRGNNYGNLFYIERNYHYFLRKYWEYLNDFVDTLAYCLLKNHFQNSLG